MKPVLIWQTRKAAQLLGAGNVIPFRHRTDGEVVEEALRTEWTVDANGEGTAENKQPVIITMVSSGFGFTAPRQSGSGTSKMCMAA